MDFKLNFKLVKKEGKDPSDIPWVVTKVGSGRKLKTCETCGKTIQIGKSSYTYTRIHKNEKGVKIFESRYVCNYECSRKLEVYLLEKGDKIELEINK